MINIFVVVIHALTFVLPRTWFTTSVQNMTGWISNTKTFALGGPDIASKIFTICIRIFPIYVQSASKIFPIPRPLCSVVRILQVKLTACIESHAHGHLIQTNQPTPFFIEKVQRDSEPGGHDARDRDGPDQLDLPHHLRPCHLPAVQPPGLLWRISGLFPLSSFCRWQMISRFPTSAQSRKLKRSRWHTSWTSPRNGRWNKIGNTNSQN